MRRVLLFLVAAGCFGQIINPPNGGAGGGATLPNTTNLIKGDGAGNGADSGLVPANVVLAVSPGAGIAHFPGASQTATSSLIVTGDITNAAITAAKMVNAGVLTGDVSGTFPATTVNALNGTALSGLATGILKNTTGTGMPSIAVGSDVCALLTLTGNVTTSAGCATSIGAGQVSLSMMANLAANSFIGNNTGAGATPIALTIGQSKTLLAIACADLTNAAASCATNALNASNINAGVLGSTFGGTGVNNGASTITLGGSLTTSGAFASTFTMTGATSVTFPTSGTLSTTTGTVTSVGQTFTGGLISVAGSPITTSGTLALTVAGTSGGVPYFSGATTWASSAAMASGQFMLGGGAGSAPTTSFSVVPLANGGTNGTDAASNGGVIYSNATQYKVLAGTATANQALLSGSSAAPAWSTATYPATTTINQLLYSSAANTIAGLATANNAVLVTSAGGVPSVAAPSANLQVSGSVLDTIQGIQTSSTPQFARVGLGQAADATALLAGTKNAIGTTSTVGFLIQNTTAAAAGAQQFSARVLDAIGQGWKTNATAASQPVEIYAQLEPIQGATNPGAALAFYAIQNNGAAQNIMDFCFPNAALGASNNGITLDEASGRCPSTGFYSINATNMFGVFNNTAQQENFTTNGLGFNSGNKLYWGSGNIGTANTGDTGICRGAVRQINLNDGSATCTNYADLGMRKMVTYNSLATVGPGVAPIYGNVSTTGNVAAITTSTLCAAAVCTGGSYTLHAYLDSTVTCATPGPASVALNLTWTDEAGTKTTQAVPLDVNGGLALTGTMALGDTTTNATGSTTLWSTGANAIQYATTYTACTVGTGTYSIRLALEQQI